MRNGQREYNRQYYLANQERLKERSRKRDKENPEAHRARGANWNERNRETRRKITRKWNAKNPHKMNAALAKRRIENEARTPLWASSKTIDAFYLIARRTGYEVDHLVPLRGITAEGHRISGLHWEGNLRFLTPLENKSKGNRMRPHEQELCERPHNPKT